MKRLFTVVFAVLIVVMFSGCTSTTPHSGISYQGDASGEIDGGSGTWGTGGS